ncbi:MAG: hypothetical protein HOG34_10570 [Bacteroidetes bacterium]|jgi:hypothetical protein|nr:hypothetical protein [Bacteroidota bacterium]
MNHKYQIVEEAINTVGEKFTKSPGLILTEDDLKCLIFHELMQSDEFSRIVRTANPEITGSVLHSEVTWYDEGGDLRYKPDISIIDAAHLSILNNLDHNIALPTKGFSFEGNAIIIELKFIRDRRVRKRQILSIMKDIQKINSLIHLNYARGNSNWIRGIVVIFSKYSDNLTSLDMLPQGLQYASNIAIIECGAL